MYSGASFETILLFDFCTALKIIIFFILIKCFTFLNKYRELLDYFCKKIPMSRFTGLSEKSFFKKNLEYGKEYEQWCYCFKFLERIRVHWMFHSGFGEIIFLKHSDVINLNSWFLTILKGFNFTVSKLTLFLKIKKDFSKYRYFICQMVTNAHKNGVFH